jgi:hypothetical protein
LLTIIIYYSIPLQIIIVNLRTYERYYNIELNYRGLISAPEFCALFFLLSFHFLEVFTCHLKHEFLVNNVLKLSSSLTLRVRPEDQFVNAAREVRSVCAENHTKQIHSVVEMWDDNVKASGSYSNHSTLKALVENITYVRGFGDIFFHCI